ncbi:unnamed protein product, partial [Pelagomonas calceolata]
GLGRLGRPLLALQLLPPRLGRVLRLRVVGLHSLVLVGEVGLALRLYGLGLDRDRRRHRGVGVVRADVDDVAARLREALALPEELLGGLLRADLEVVVAGVVHWWCLRPRGGCAAGCFRWRLARTWGAQAYRFLPVAR